MSVLGWIIFGALAGWLASKIVNMRGSGCFANIAIGLIGAMVGGAIFRSITEFDIFEFNLASMFVAVIGAVITLFVWHVITGRHRW